MFDFTVDKEAKTIRITREFAADVDLVWDAFTKPEIIVQWTAPKPYRAHFKEMDFRVGGRSLMAMVSPEDVSHWSKVEFLEIDPKNSFTGRNSFSDENGNTLHDKFSLTKTSFKQEKDKTTVHIEKVFDDLEVVEMMVARGFKEGTAATMENLDEYFLTLVPNHNA
jgi:PhnB protein